MRFWLRLNVSLIGLCIVLISGVLIYNRWRNPSPSWIAFYSDRFPAPGGFYLMSPDGDDVHLIMLNRPSLAAPILWSPDASRLMLQQINEAYEYQLVVVGLAGQHLYAEDVPPIFGSRQAWSPDGEWIVFEGMPVADLAQGVALHRMRSDGSALSCLLPVTDNPRLHNLDWSPDGQWIVATRAEPEMGVYRLRPDGSDLQLLYQSLKIHLAKWSPDGAWIAALVSERGVDRVYGMRPDGSQFQPITPDDTYASSLAWTPDGQWIVCSLQVRGQVRGLYRTRPDGTDIQQITDLEIFYARLSPDGQWLIYTLHTGGQESGLYRIRPDGTDMQQLTTIPAFDFRLSPDGQWIAFDSAPDPTLAGGRDIYRVRLDGSQLQRLTNNSSDDSDPTWSPAAHYPYQGRIMLIVGMALIMAGFAPWSRWLRA